MRKQRRDRPWPKVNGIAKNHSGKLPFEPIDIDLILNDKMNRFELLKTCEIDPTVYPFGIKKVEKMLR